MAEKPPDSMQHLLPVSMTIITSWAVAEECWSPFPPCTQVRFRQDLLRCVIGEKHFRVKAAYFASAGEQEITGGDCAYDHAYFVPINARLTLEMLNWSRFEYYVLRSVLA